MLPNPARNSPIKMKKMPNSLAWCSCCVVKSASSSDALKLASGKQICPCIEPNPSFQICWLSVTRSLVVSAAKLIKNIRLLRIYQVWSNDFMQKWIYFERNIVLGQYYLLSRHLQLFFLIQNYDFWILNNLWYKQEQVTTKIEFNLLFKKKNL